MKFSIGEVVYTRDGFSNIFDKHHELDKYGGYGYKEGLRLVITSRMLNNYYTNSYRFDSIDFAIYEKALMPESEYFFKTREEKLIELLR
jgi:hypothetical protein